jgi:hypothetical protein
VVGGGPASGLGQSPPVIGQLAVFTELPSMSVAWFVGSEIHVAPSTKNL